MAKFEIERDFTSQELDALMDALDDWEYRDVEMLSVIERLKRLPEPPAINEEDFETEESFNYAKNYRESFVSFKKQMLEQEDKARSDRKFRRERATMLKAKIILMKDSKAADDIFDDAAAAVKKKF